MSDHYDVIIIGTGAGGGTLAHRLAPSGKRILLLERGGYLPREPENWDSEEVFSKDRYLSDEKWIDKDGDAVPARTSSTSSAATPSSTARSSSACASATSARSSHYGGVSPAWPISYADLEPYYAEAERLYLVHGAGRRGPDRAAALGPVPVPGRLARAAHPAARTTTSRATGHHPFHLPVGVDLNESDPEAGRCVRCDRFDGFPCLTDGKADAHVLLRAPGAHSTTNVTLLHAREGRAARDRRARRARVTRGRRRPPRRARSATAPTSSSSPAARSTRRRCCCARPTTGTRNGLANSSDVVGRHYMAHINSGVIAISQTPNPTQVPEDARRQRLLLGRRRLRAPARAHPDARQVATATSCAAGAPWFAPGLALDYMAKHAIDFWLTTEDLPHPDNRVTVDRDGRIHLAKTYHNDEAAPAAAGQAQGPARRTLGCHETAIPSWSILDQRIPLAGVAHQCGTVRFGDDPATLGARRQLQGARPRQPLRRRHELLPVVERREPGADRDGERAARRRPPARAARRRAPRPADRTAQAEEVAS